MIDHITMAVRDVELSKVFYLKVFETLGYKVAFGTQNSFWAFDIGRGLFEIYQSKNNAKLTPFHVAFRASSYQMIHDFYNAAIEAGALDNGKPGPRPHYTDHYYACFVIDPDGNNIEAMHDVWNDWE
ncbi:VOC family protein [Celerinatantimonas yamalensis]|uniref:VOC family protein n=1 Tax=Celerinatantimonas yamalensis TaxID=559956 RepID=A0ABW9G7F4_9GAMM